MAARVWLENKHLRAGIALKGAELQSLVSVQSSEEWIWCGDPTFWAKHSPILFPIVGMLRNGCFEYRNQCYPMGRHGFARDMDFVCVEKDEHSARFLLMHTEDTLRLFPFEFELFVTYTLFENEIQLRYEVLNPSNAEDLWFSIGGHPAFALAAEDQDISHYALRFPKDRLLTAHRLSDGLRSTEIQHIALDADGFLHLSEQLFSNDALVLTGLKSEEVHFVCNTSNRSLVMRYDGFPWFGIWKTSGAPFLCLEPWAGVTDTILHNSKLTQKEGILHLLPQESWQASWQLCILE
jgi:galactose mutarotase-like enzyme